MCMAFGYVDPGAGSYLFQLLIAGLSTLAFFFFGLRQKIMSWIHRGKPVDEDSGPGVEAPSDEEKN
jgi:hypothetical protein